MSSFFSSIFSGNAASGPTGPIGSTGPDGPLGPTGNSAPGATGIGLSLGIPYSWAASTKILTQTLSDNSQSKISIIGPTGFYQARVFSFCTGCTNSIVSSSTQSSLLKTSGTKAVNAPIAYGDVITLKNITTDTPEDIGITYTDIRRNTISVTYTPKITGLSFSDASLGLIVKLGTGGTTTTVFGSTGSLYTPSIQTADFKVRSYQERVVNVFPDKLELVTSDALRWTLNIDGPTFASIFQLMPCNLSECRADARYIDIVQTTTTPLYAKGITIIVPSGVTMGGPPFDCVSTGSCSELPGVLTTYFTYNYPTDGLVVKFPLGRPVCFTDRLDIINLISIRNTWYGSYVGGFTAGTNVPYDPATMTIYNPNTITEVDTLCDGCGPLITYEGYMCASSGTYNTFNGVVC